MLIVQAYRKKDLWGFWASPNISKEVPGGRSMGRRVRMFAGSLLQDSDMKLQEEGKAIKDPTGMQSAQARTYTKL